jgi:CheY-like chemotaxis protein
VSRQAHVLVVEDDEEIRAFVTMALGDEGYRVTAAPHGAAALALLTATEPLRPDVILLDLRMPVMDGWQFAARYRDLPPPHVPIVAVTATRDVGDRATQVQADTILSKPFELDQLLAVVARYTAH